MKNIAGAAARLARLLLFCSMLPLAACSVFDKPTRAAVYDFGPGDNTATMAPAAAAAAMPAIALLDVESASALDSTALLYRLAYANDQQLSPYAQARWSMPPAQLLQQRLRESLGRDRLVLRAGDGVAARGAQPLVLQMTLDEFSQLFEQPGRSVGLVRVSATVIRPSSGGDQLLGQRSFVARRPAPSPDAAGGVRALTAASDGVVEEIGQWLTSLR